MTEHDPLRLAQLLCARLCHDLAGPLGGAAAGAELLADEAGDLGDPAAEAVALIAGSVRSAAARLAFLRAALGQGGAPSGSAGLRRMIEATLADGPVTLDWRDADEGACWEPGAAKLLLNLALLGREALPRGGRLTVEVAAGAPRRLTVTAEGLGAGAGEVSLGLNASSAAALTPRSVLGFHAALLAGGLGCRLTVEERPGRVTLVGTI